MKTSHGLFAVLFLFVILLPFASANWFSDRWDKMEDSLESGFDRSTDWAKRQWDDVRDCCSVHVNAHDRYYSRHHYSSYYVQPVYYQPVVVPPVYYYMYSSPYPSYIVYP